ncbi:MAG TPA: tetratricopeptide repeat protein [Variovorax sp.]
MKHAAFSRLSIAFALLFSLWGSAVHANEYDDVNALLRQGKSNDALAKADTYIAGKPRDPQMRFLRGVILTEQNKQAEAIAAFTQLTQDFPELSEPYNNLAALYASQSKFDQARAALEQALKLNPNYATAHENLGDVYARLAAQEYVRAQQFASTNASVAPKLALIRQIFSSKTEAEAAALPAPPVVIRKPVGRTSK